jgi:Secretion system C-terminal sorting domain
MKKKLHYLFILFLLPAFTYTQITITYPSPAQGFTRGLDQTLLTVNIDFTTFCKGTTVTVALPPTVKYVAGSVIKTGGSGAAIDITENNITNLNAPIFNLLRTTGPGNITFTIKREAGCGLFTGGKDTIKVNGACGSVIENSANINTYNILSPVLNMVPPAAINNAVLGGSYTRTTTVGNGGNGCTDTLWYYIIYPSGSIINTAANTITANGTNFTPVRTNGDTLFYKIFGAAVFGASKLFCNGQNVTITEPVKLLSCINNTTTYGAGWGKSLNSSCQQVTGTSIFSMATGSANFTAINAAQVGFVDKCTPFAYTFTVNNSGTGNITAAAMYDLSIQQGHTWTTAIFYGMDLSLFSFSNATINGNPVPFTIPGGIINLNLNNFFTTDPDGAGTGLADMDGDGFFDDLPAGTSLTIKIDVVMKCDIPCGYNKVNYGVAAKLTYRTMCDNTPITTGLLISNKAMYLYESLFAGTGYMPANVGGTPFRIKLEENHYANSSTFDGSNTRYRWKVALPPGFSVSGSGSPVYGTTPVSYTTSGDTVIFTSSSNYLDSFSITLIYTCGSPGIKTINYSLEKINNITTGCTCQSKLICASLSALTYCPNYCPAGPTTSLPVVRRADGSLGWTDYTLSTRVSAAAVSGYDLSKALYLDTINIISSAIQNNAANNLHIELKLPKTSIAPTGLNKLRGIKVDVAVYRLGVLLKSSITTVTTSTASTATMQAIDWDLTSNLPTGGLLAGDSIYTVSSYVVATNSGLPRNDVQSGSTWTFYNVNATGGKDMCNSFIPEMYLAGTDLVNGANPYATNACAPNSLGGSTNYIARRFNTSGVLFEKEFRPTMYIDSIVAVIPAGYKWNYTNLEYNTGGGPNFPALIPAISGNVYTFKNPGNWQALGLTVTNIYGAYMPFNITPTCATLSTEPLNVKIYIRDYYYAYAGRATPTGLSYVLGSATGQTRDINYSNKPNIVLTDLTGTVQGTSNAHNWNIRMSSIGSATAPYTWIAIPAKAGITVTKVTEVSTSTVITPITYGGGTWYKLSNTGITNGSFKDYKLDFTYTTCSLDSIKVLAGWNCSSFPADPDAYICGQDALFLKVAPQSSQMQLIIQRQPGAGSPITLCTNDSTLVIVNSALSANLLTPYVELYPPTGVNIQTPIKVEYPLGSGNYQNTITTAIPGGYKVDLTGHTGISTNGMPGTASNPGATGRQAKLKIVYTIDCSITSGSQFRFDAFGKMPCGAPAIGNGVTVNTATINIAGATATGSMGMSLSLSSSIFECGSVNTLFSTLTPVSVNTQTGDTAIYTLPPTIQYGGNFSGCSACTVTTGSDAAGNNVVKVKLQPGIAFGTSLNYSFDLVSGGLGCANTATLSAVTKRNIPALTCGTVTCTSASSIIIGSATIGGIAVNKPDLYTTNFSTTQEVTGSSVKIDYNFKVTNTGSMAAPGSTYLGKIYCGYGTGGQVLASFHINGTGSGVTNTQSGSFTFNTPLQCVTPSTFFLQIQDTLVTGAKACLCDNAAGVTSAQVLPVRLKDFTATAEDNKAKISWLAEDEINVNRYEVEHSTNGTGFAKAGTITAANSRNYSLFHHSPVAGLNYYRLKIIDNNGHFNYSDVRRISFGNKGNITLYPNPASSIVNITIPDKLINKSTGISIMSIDGRVVYKKRSVTTGRIQTINVAAIAEGKYYVSIETQDEIINMPLNIIR